MHGIWMVLLAFLMTLTPIRGEVRPGTDAARMDHMAARIEQTGWRADELAMAMESRCYHGGSGRTRMRILRLRWQDLLSVALLASLFAVTVVWG